MTDLRGVNYETPYKRVEFDFGKRTGVGYATGCEIDCFAGLNSNPFTILEPVDMTMQMYRSNLVADGILSTGADTMLKMTIINNSSGENPSFSIKYTMLNGSEIEETKELDDSACFAMFNIYQLNASNTFFNFYTDLKVTYYVE